MVALIAVLTVSSASAGTSDSVQWIAKVNGEVWVPLAFPLDSPLDLSDPLYTDRLSAGMQLKGQCPDAECSLIPVGNEVSASTLNIDLTRFAIHLRGKAGVTHAAECHAKSGLIGATTTLRITRPPTDP